MAKDKYQYAHEAWKKENMIRYTLRISKKSKTDMISHIEKNRPVNNYLRGLVEQDMDTHRKWAICMGVAMAAEQARRFNWKELYEQLGKLSAELGRELGLTPDQVYREAHQVQERERL